ncbi:MAG: right-handed parallel beta-helix repeat-containing protein [Kiritimatiellales bacterium]|nr:right-handed parallel beta-helix repeat-containing protein [Kiritimatiellales bacterium]
MAVQSAVTSGVPLTLRPGEVAQVTVTGMFTSLASAMDSMAGWIIPDNASVTIHLGSGTVVSTQSINLRHTFGANIRIRGASPAVTTASLAEAPVRQADGGWAVKLTLAKAAGIGAADYMIVRDPVGNDLSSLYAGVWKILDITGNIATLRSTVASARLAQASMTNANVTVLKTVLSFTGANGINVAGSIGDLDAVAVVGDQTAGGIGIISGRMIQAGTAQGRIHLGSAVGVVGFNVGIAGQYGSTVDAPKVAVSGCTVYGLLAQHGGTIFANEGIVSGNTGNGIAASNNGDISFESGLAAGNGLNGIYAFAGGSILAKNGRALANAGNGIQSSYGGAIRLHGTAKVSSSNYNGGAGFAVHQGNLYSEDTVAYSNDGDGYFSDGGAITANRARASANRGDGFEAIDHGSIEAQKSRADGNRRSFSASGLSFIDASGSSAQSFFAETKALIYATDAVSATADTELVATPGFTLDASGRRLVLGN